MSWERTPGAGGYARDEVERRWLLSAVPDGCTDPCEIVDRYLTGTRLRLRRMDHASGTTYKLGQKVRVADDDPARVRITNIYLSAEEYSVLAALPAAELVKTRRRCGAFAIDEFHGPLEGLVLAELEVTDLAAPVEPPPNALTEVTHDPRYAGGSLATATALPS